MGSGGLSLMRPVVVQLSKIKSTPKGLGRFADLVVCRVTHAPSLTVSKTGGGFNEFGLNDTLRYAFGPLFIGTKELFRLFSV